MHACYVKQLKNGRFELEQPLKFACMDYEALLYVGHLREMFINADFEMHTVCILYLATLTLIFLILNNLIVKYKSIHNRCNTSFRIKLKPTIILYIVGYEEKVIMIANNLLFLESLFCNVERLKFLV